MKEQLNKKEKTQSVLPKSPRLHEEPVGGQLLGKEVCKICGKLFKTHSELDRHMENVHGEPEKTHTGPHRIE